MDHIASKSSDLDQIQRCVARNSVQHRNAVCQHSNFFPFRELERYQTLHIIHPEEITEKRIKDNERTLSEGLKLQPIVYFIMQEDLVCPICAKTSETSTHCPYLCPFCSCNLISLSYDIPRMD